MSNHDEFRRKLWKSMLDVHAVAGMYAKHPAIDILIPEVRIPAMADSLFAKSDSGDLRIRKDGGDWKFIEVKGYSATIQEAERFPVIIVDRKVAYDAKDPTPDYYFSVYGDREWALYHDHRSHKDKLAVHKFKDQNTGNLEDCYVLQNQFWTKIRLRS
jgi:hypothetical protein